MMVENPVIELNTDKYYSVNQKAIKQLIKTALHIQVLYKQENISEWISTFWIIILLWKITNYWIVQ